MKSNTRTSVFTKPVKAIGLIVILVFVLAACAPAPTPPADIPVTAATAAPVATMAPAATATAAMVEASLSTATDPKFGKILVDGKGMTLYMFTKDAPDKSNCTDSCLKLWPPLLTQGSPSLGDGIDASLVGSTALPDGTKIVTYNKMPLYYWASDSKPGEITGLGVGGVWFLVSSTGKIVGREAAIDLATDPKFGKILVDDKGMTLYMYTKDEADKSNCADKCLAAWPPLVTSGSPKLGDGVDKSRIGSTALPDGTQIVTYNHMPLYYFAKDAKAGDITGLGVGGVWYMVSPEGKIVGQDVTINVATDPKYGKILVDGKGMTLYMYTKDEADKSNCADKCLAAWPPLLTLGKPKLGDGVDDSKIGSTALADGTLIVTYNHMPLYYFAKDAKPGDMTGVGVGTVWYLVSPDGKIVGK
jgi:predicted lipoprotein with Yx(FWY)xxD motif